MEAQLARHTRLKPRQPGYEGKFELVPDIVESAYVKGEFEPVIRNVRESSLSAMRRNKLIDEAQEAAGDWFRKTYERTRMGSMAIDPSREPVDISGRADPIPDRVIAAAEALAQARRELGVVGYLLVELICGQGWTVEEATQGRGARSVWRLFRLALDNLAEWRGYGKRVD